ncbi:MAG: right-handed parallel beta-helix repeat-containing protein, partial [Bacteroidota bacterium]|nr:right-handed parallel beta-helix repeat-containing protein [Bacteroidota bacterium]
VTYYVSATGNDNNLGLTPSTPWQSISKVNSMMILFLPGDQILFKRGDKFYGTLTVDKSGLAGIDIIFGSYGTGELPMITGKKLITGWIPHSGSIYKATVSDTIWNLYSNQKIMTVARFPNTGFMKIDAGNGTNGFYDAALQPPPSGNWVGANCRVRLINWSYATRVVSSYSGGNITFTSPTSTNVYADYGYYLDNKLSLLDVAGEWYQDRATNTVYLFAPGGLDPNNLSVEGIVNKRNIVTNYNINNVKIQDLHITGCKEKGIEVMNGNSITIQRCLINQTGKFGINLTGNNGVVDNNIFEDNLNSAINSTITNGTIKNNTVRTTGLIPGYGEDDWGYIAMNLSSSQGLLVEKNTIDSTGYTAIVSGADFVIKNNRISNSVLTLNDGGGIFIVSANGLQILNNIISTSIGNSESSANPPLYAIGIYVNGGVVNNTTIEGNTVYDNRYAGILIDIINSSVNNKIMKNTAYNNFVGQILFTDYSSTSYISNYNFTVKGNVFYSLSTSQNCMEQMNFVQSSFSDWGTFDSNYYCNPYSEFVIRKTKLAPVYTSIVYNLATWKTNFNEDPNSKTSLVSFSQYGVTDTLSSNLITNSQFNTDVSNWGPNSKISHFIHPALDGGSMRIRWAGGNPYSFTTSRPTFSIVKDSYYLASISCVGVNSGSFSLWTYPSNLPYTYFTYGTTRKNHSYILKSDTTNLTQTFSIQMALPDTLLYVDNVSFYKVNVQKLDSTQMSKLFVNENNFTSSIPLGGNVYKDLNGNTVTGSITLQPYSSQILTNENPLAVGKSLQLKTLIEGFYNPTTDLMSVDSVRVFLRNSSGPYNIIDSSKSVLDANGNGSFNFSNASNSVNYYLVVEHRNSVETWSMLPVSFTTNFLNYDFTTSSDKAFGNNLRLKGTRFTIFGGDVNTDDEVNLVDLLQTYNAGTNFTTGYVREDVDGSGIVNLHDLTLVYNNSAAFVRKISP